MGHSSPRVRSCIAAVLTHTCKPLRRFALLFPLFSNARTGARDQPPHTRQSSRREINSKMGAHRHGLRRLSSGRRSSAIPFNLDQTAAVVTLLVVGSWVIVPAFALEASPAQRAKAVVLDAPPKWAPALDSAARDRALAPVFVSEGLKSTLGLRARVKGATVERRRGRDAETILEREGGTKLVVVAAGLGDDVSRALARAAKAAEAFGKAIREGTKLVIAVPDATELMNRAFAAFAYTLDGGGAALVANVPYAASREAALAVVDAAPRVAEAAPTAAPVWLVALLALALGLAIGRGARAIAPKAEVVKMVPVVAEPDSHVVSENEATFDESDTDDEELFDDSEEDDDELRAVTTGRVTPSPIPAAERAAEAMFGEATTFDESDDEKPAFEDSGDEDEAPLP